MSSPVPLAAVLQDGLDPVVMLARHLLELVADNEPAGERPRGLLDVFFGVMAAAEREELHHFTGVVLVGLGLLVDRRVQPDQHGRVLADRGYERAEVAQRLRAEQVVLAEHEARVLDLGVEVAKWLCQNRVMRSRSGCGVKIIRYSQMA